MELLQQQVDFYKTNGYLSPVTVVDSAQASQWREQFDALEDRVGTEKAQLGLRDYHFDEKFIWEIATHATVLDAMEAVMGANILLLATHFFCKYGEGETGEKFVAWHQDVTFWGLEPPYAVTAWYAVDDADRENGCMQVIPATHESGVLKHGKSQRRGNLLSINQEVSVRPEDAARAVDIELKAGQMSLHDGTLIHGSLPNMSDRRRCGLTLRYVPTWVRQTQQNSHGEGWHAVLVRGEDAEKNFGDTAAPFPLPSAA